jgi:hypothetical protein
MHNCTFHRVLTHRDAVLAGNHMQNTVTHSYLFLSIPGWISYNLIETPAFKVISRCAGSFERVRKRLNYPRKQVYLCGFS